MADAVETRSRREIPDALLDFDALARAVVADDPCPHLVVPGFVPARILTELARCNPDIRHGGSFAIGRFGGQVDLSPLHERLIAELTSDGLKDALGRKFGADYMRHPHYVTMRGRTRAKDGRIHLDSEEKEVTILLYLNHSDEAGSKWPHAGGRLRFYRDPAKPDAVAREISPDGGTLVVFPKNARAWHGHTTHCGDRLSVQVNYLRSRRDVLYNYGRHRLSGFLKKRFSRKRPAV